VVTYPTVLPQYFNTKDKINPYVFIQELFKALSRDDVIITGNGSACVVTFQAAQLKEGQRLFTNSGSASMGYDLPAAIGASLALNKKRIICLAGDGSLMMNLQELETMQGYKLPIKVIVLNNYGYASIRQTQEAYFSDNLFGIGPEDGVTLPDFIALGKALKIPSIKVNSIEEWLSDSVQELLNSKDSALIEVMLDPKQTFSPKLTSKKLPDGTMVSPALEDMAPFLSKEELARNTL
jgi:acetolactate synthase-1/2/3 large subunit